MDKNRKQNGYMAAVIICLMIVIVVCIIIVSGRKKSGEMEYHNTGFCMGTVLTITVYGSDGEQCTEDIKELLDSLEKNVISWRSVDSEVWKLNHEYKAGVPYAVSDELAADIDKVKELYEKGDGLLDATIRPLAALWGIEDGKSTIPDRDEIEKVLKNVDMGLVDITLKTKESERASVTISQSDMSIDLGSVGKGIGCDKVYAYLRNSNVTGACIAIGGSIVIYGSKPDNSSYKLGIRNPRSETEDVMGVLQLEAGTNGIFVSTSGDYEKYFETDGTRYHHILNPVTGYPANEGLISATIVCDNGLISDGLSTLSILMGRESVMALLKSYGAEAVLIDESKNVYVTDGLKDCFLLKSDDYKVIE